MQPWLKRQKIRQPVERVSIIVSHVDPWKEVYPGLIMANGARMEGIEALPSFHILRPGRDCA